MKKLILILLLALPLLIYAEYNGVHVKFEIELKSGKQIIGYKYIAHGKNTTTYKQRLENNPELLLLNQYTYEPGECGYYTERLEYYYEESILFKLINPVELSLKEIKNINIVDLITASYAIQIIGDFDITDQSWMKSKPIAKYSEYNEMCIYNTFIHSIYNDSTEIKDKIESIIKEAESNIKKKEIELNISEGYNDLYQEQMKEIYKERDFKILNLLKENNDLKTITISLCTC